MKNQKLPAGGIKIKSISVICITVCMLIMILIHIEILHVDRSCQSLIHDTQTSIEGQLCAISLGRSSDFLTENVRLFVVRQEPGYMHRYFQEIESKNRENMVDRLNFLLGDLEPETVARLNEALRESNNLETLEIHAMSLISRAIALPEEALPDAVAAWELTDEEKALTEEALIDRSFNLVYGLEYLRAKERIKTDINDTLDLITDNMKQIQAESGGKLRNIFREQRFYSLLMVLLIGLISLVIGALIVYPIKKHVRSIQEGKPWKMLGVHELQYLACIYNQIFDQNEAYKKELEYKAEHDALTGMCNRAAFDRIKEELSEQKTRVALILADINEFKRINDTRGHKAGDEALKRTAKVLNSLTFENLCCIARIGGDEFAILLQDVTAESFPAIQEEVRTLNKILASADGAVPAISVSVGASFSESGYSDRLFQQADMAMYHAKQQKCKDGCLFDESFQ